MKRFFTRLWFKYQLSKGKLITVNDSHRGIGKTTMLINRSVKHNMPILVGSQMVIDVINHINPKAEVYGFAPNFTNGVKSRRFPNGVLIDESVAEEVLEQLNHKIMGGFRNEK